MKFARSLVLLFVAALLICSAFWLRQSRADKGVEIAATNTTPGGLSKDEEKVDAPRSRPADFAKASAEQQNKLSEMGITSDMTKEQMAQRVTDLTRGQRETVAENWRKQIEFYGMVEDQNDRPVSEVQVHFVWTDTSASGSSELNQLTDAQGKFALTGKTGRMLQVWLNKNGYYVPKTNLNNFDYATGYMADVNNPVIFRLIKKGEGADLITSQQGMSSTLNFSASTRDGTPVKVDFFTRKAGAEGQMQVSQNKPALGAWQTATEWSYRLAIPDGGFVETTEEFPFKAPETGYKPVIEFKFKKGDPNWTERINKAFYIAFGTPRKYGRVRIETSMTTGTILEYAINPDGSQNLEAK